MITAIRKVQSDDAVLLVVDVQEKLLPSIHEADRVVDACVRMIRAVSVLGLPILTTEQYTKGLGVTVEAVRAAYPGEAYRPIEKLCFSAAGVPVVIERLAELHRRFVVVVGIEAHVCVQQTVLDLLACEYVPVVCADAIGSRRAFDRQIALERMRQAGAIVTTTEAVIFELLGAAGTDTFKQMLPIVK